MEWLPQETILYPNAHYSPLKKRAFDLADNAKFIGWESHVSAYGQNHQDFW